nr:MAG TPA: Protein of unknown function (DUF2509) [Caudoviricetes sp.]
MSMKLKSFRNIIRLPPARWLSFCPERISD